jgi:hypothetical protein
VARLWVVGYVTDWYQSFWFEHQTGLVQNECISNIFVVTDISLCKFGERTKILERKFLKFVSRFELK